MSRFSICIRLVYIRCHQRLNVHASTVALKPGSLYSSPTCIDNLADQVKILQTDVDTLALLRQELELEAKLWKYKCMHSKRRLGRLQTQLRLAHGGLGRIQKKVHDCLENKKSLKLEAHAGSEEAGFVRNENLECRAQIELDRKIVRLSSLEQELSNLERTNCP